MEALKRLGERSSVFILAVISALRGTLNNMRMVIWQPFVLSLGVPISGLGGLESLMSLIRILIQPVFGNASDIYGRKKFLVFRDLLVISAGLLFVFSRSMRLLFPGVVLISLSVAILPIWSTVVAESAGDHEVGYIYSIVETSSTAAGLFATLTAGLIATAYGYSSVFVVVTIIGLASLLLIIAKLPETRHPGPDSRLSIGGVVSSLSKTVKPSPHLRGFYIAMSLDLFAWSLGHRFLSGILAKDYGYTPYMLGVLSAAMTGTMALTQISLGKLADRVGYSRILAFSQFLGCLVLVLVIVSKRFEVVLVGRVLLGLSAALWMPAQQAWIARNVDPGERAQSIGSFSTFRSLIALPAPIVGGFLIDAYGFDLPMFINLALAIVDVGLLWFLVRD